MENEVLSFTCPRCGAVSYNPDDRREGYCVRCHDWTRNG
jgi:ribosomal protein L37E